MVKSEVGRRPQRPYFKSKQKDPKRSSTRSFIWPGKLLFLMNSEITARKCKAHVGLCRGISRRPRNISVERRFEVDRQSRRFDLLCERVSLKWSKVFSFFWYKWNGLRLRRLGCHKETSFFIWGLSVGQMEWVGSMARGCTELRALMPPCERP